MGPHGNSAKKKPNGTRSSAGHAAVALTPPMRNEKAPREARDASHSDDDGVASPSTPAQSSQAAAAPATDSSSSGAGLGMMTDAVQPRPPKAATFSAVPLISVVEAYEAAVNDLGDASSSPDLLCALGLHPVGSGAIYDAAHVLLLTSQQDVALQPLEGGATVVEPATAAGAAMAVRSAVLADEEQHSWMGSVTALACGHTACSVCVASAGATVKCHCGVLTAVPTNATAAAQGNKDSSNNGSGSGIRDAVALLPTHAAATAWARHLLSVAFRSALRQAEAAASSQAAPSHCGTSQGTSQGAAVAAGAPRPLCGYCEEAPEVVHCVECNFGLCETCRDTVHAKGRFKTHTLTPSASGAPQETLQQQNASSRRSAAGHSAAPAFAPAPTTTCAEHPSYPLELYCRKCEACICLRCHYSGPHKGHETTPLGDLLGAIRAELQQQESKIRDGAAVWQAVWDRLGKAAATLSTEAETIRAAVRGQFAAARSLLDEAEAQSLLEADAYLRARRAAVSEDVDDACRLALRLRGAGVGMRLALGGEASATGNNGNNNSSTVAATTLLKYHGAITRQSTAIVASDAHISAAVHAGAAKYSAALEAACAAWEDLRHVAVCSSEPTSSSAAAAALRLAVSHALAAVTAKAGGHFVSSSRDASERVLDTTLAALTTTPRPKSPSAMGRHANHHQQHLQQHHQQQQSMQPTRSSSDMTLGRLLQEAEMGAGSSHTKQQQQQLQKQQPAPLQRAVAPPAVVAAPLLESVDPPSHFGFATQEPTVNLFGGGSRGAATAMHLQALTAQWGLTQQPQPQQLPAASSSGRGSGWQPTAADAPPPKAHRVELISPALEQQQPPSGVALSPPRAAAPAAAVGPKAAMAAARNAATLNFGPRKGNKGGGNSSGGVPSPQTSAPANSTAGGFQLHI